MKRYHLWVSIAAIAAFGFLLSQDALARLAWQRYGRADIALALNRSDAALAMQIGNYYFNGGAYDLGKAEQAYRRAAELDPQLLGSAYQLVRIDFLRGNFPEALEKANEIAAQYPEFKRVHYLRGLIHGYAGDLDAAAADFRAFLEWDPKSWAGHNDLAWVYFKTGQYRRVEEAARAGLAWNPENPWLLTSLGVALLNQQKNDGARIALEGAQKAAELLTVADWHRAYPGNDPLWAQNGLDSMRRTIQVNLALVEQRRWLPPPQ